MTEHMRRVPLIDGIEKITISDITSRLFGSTRYMLPYAPPQPKLPTDFMPSAPSRSTVSKPSPKPLPDTA